MVEVIIVIAVVGIMSGLGMAGYGKITEASRRGVGQNLVETLNNATKKFGHAQYKIVSTGENADDTDEKHILKTLQWVDPDIEFGVAGPFMRPDWLPEGSGDETAYRAVWAGSYWKMVQPGEEGTGLKINFEAEDLGGAPDEVHPIGFYPVNSKGTNLGDWLQGDSISVALAGGDGSGSLAQDTLNTIDFFQPSVQVESSDDFTPIGSFEEGIGQQISDELSAQLDLSGVNASITVEVDDSAANSSHADLLADLIASTLLGQSGDSDSQNVVVDQNTNTITFSANVETETGEVISATATIVAEDVSGGAEAVDDLVDAVVSAEAAATVAEDSGNTELAAATTAAVDAAVDAAQLADAVVEGTADIADAEAAAEAANEAAATVQEQVDQMAADDVNLVASQEAATAAQDAADAATEVVAVVNASETPVDPVDNTTNPDGTPVEEEPDAVDQLFDDILDTFTNSF